MDKRMGTGPSRVPLRVWSTKNYKLHMTFGTGLGQPLFSSDWSILLEGRNLWHVPTKKHLATIPKEIVKAAFSPDGELLAAIVREPKNLLQLFDTKTGQAKATLSTSVRGQIFGFTPDGQWLLSDVTDVVSGKTKIKAWDLRKIGDEVLPLTSGAGAGYAKTAVCFAPDGMTIVTAVNQQVPIRTHNSLRTAQRYGDIVLWNKKTGQAQTVLPGDGKVVHSVCVSPNGQLLAAGRHDGTVKLWNLKPAKLKVTLSAHKGAVTAVSFSPETKLLASAGQDGSINLWDLSSGKLLMKFAAQGKVHALCFHPSKNLLASTGEDGKVKLWDINTPTIPTTLPGHTTPVTALRFSRDGNRLASGGKDGKVKLWNISTGKELLVLKKAHTESVIAIDFSPDGTRLATASGVRFRPTLPTPNTKPGSPEQVGARQQQSTLMQRYTWLDKQTRSGKRWTIKLWNLKTGKELDSFASQVPFQGVLFAPEGKELLLVDLTSLRFWSSRAKSRH